jgi:hypothetical protein
MFGFDSIGDMFDGGGAGASGGSFSGGGFVSDMANAVASPYGSRPQGRPDIGAMRAGQANPSFLQDMFNGGGMGASGDAFKGGPLGGLLNRLGIDPYGTEDRATLASYDAARMAPPAVERAIQEAQGPAAGAYDQTQMMRPQARPYEAYGVPPPVSEYPMSDFGDLLMRLEREGIPYAPRSQPMFGPR